MLALLLATTLPLSPQEPEPPPPPDEPEFASQVPS
jgi:hypothetical protein